jgi:hypothetical protein
MLNEADLILILECDMTIMSIIIHVSFQMLNRLFTMLYLPDDSYSVLKQFGT